MGVLGIVLATVARERYGGFDVKNRYFCLLGLRIAFISVIIYWFITILSPPLLPICTVLLCTLFSFKYFRDLIRFINKSSKRRKTEKEILRCLEDKTATLDTAHEETFNYLGTYELECPHCGSFYPELGEYDSYEGHLLNNGLHIEICYKCENVFAIRTVKAEKEEKYEFTTCKILFKK
jgi:hypothetical protein